MYIYRNEGTWKTIYMKAEPTNTDSGVVIPIVIKVCGVRETVEITNPTVMPPHQYNSTNGTQVINNTMVQSYFGASNESECPIIGFELTNYADFSYQESGSKKYTISSTFTNVFEKAGVTDQHSTYFINIMAGQQYLGNKTILP